MPTINNMITIEYLKDLFLEKYGDSLFIEGESPKEVLVTLTKDQYKELNNDLINTTGSDMLLLIDESELSINPEDLLFTKISIYNLCDFVITLGDCFNFRLADETLQYGEEEL